MEDWKYCVCGNIKKSHIDENGVLRYGTQAFTGGTKVYLCGKFWDNANEIITVIGLNRFKKYEVMDISPNLIENVRCKRVYRSKVLHIMRDYEFREFWWDNKNTDRKETIEFVKRWNQE